jgi:hypothetical protein
MPSPSHWRPGTSQPNSRSPSTAATITPVDITAWTIESGASASAPTWSSHAPAAIPIPTANHFDRISARALASGRFRSTSGAAFAPRCLHRNASCVTTAHASASAIPRLTVKKKSSVACCSLNPTHSVAHRGRPRIGRAANAAPPALLVSTTTAA